MNGIIGGQMEMPDPIQEALLDEIARLTKQLKKHQEYEPLLDVVECLSTENTKKVEALALALLREQDALHAEGDS